MAGLIPQQFIDDLLDRTDIVEIIDGRVTLRKTGQNYSGLCPFHNEKSPSFTVSQTKQFYHCFGCGANGNAIGFLMEFERLEFPAAVEAIARNAGIEMPVERQANPERKKQQDSLYDQLERAQQFFTQQLRQHPSREKAVNYLKGRQLTGETAKKFVIGYAPPGWENLHSELAKSEKDEQQLIEAGMLVKREDRDGCYDRFRDRIIFPIRDSRGRTIAFGGRVLGDDKPKYLNSPESPVFHKGNELYGLYEAKQASNRLSRFLIVEGYMDVVALAQHGIHYAVATLGTSTSDTHLNKLFRMVSEIIICFDGDAAGRKAAARALDTALPILEDGRQIRFLFLPDGEDPDSLVHKEGKDAFTQRLNQATTLTDYFFSSVSEGLDSNSLDGKARISKLALEKMQPMPRGVLYELMVKKLAEMTGLSVESLKENAAKEPQKPATNAISHTESSDNYHYPESAGEHDNYSDYNNDYQPDYGSQPSSPPTKPNKQRRSRTTQPAESAAALLLHNPELASKVDDIEPLRAVDSIGMEQLVELLELLKKQPDLNTVGILAHWQGAHGEEASEQLKSLASREQLVTKDNLQSSFLDTLSHLQKHHNEQQLEQLLKHAKHTPLTIDEKQQLQALLLAKHYKSK
ncbi:MAG: DNA primase [Pseudomonadales bacterium]